MIHQNDTQSLFLSKKIREYRKEKGISQERFGEMLGISPQAVSKWERGLCYPDISFLPAIAKLLGCTIDGLFDVK